jgi:CRP/FNR family transcriptional regulator, cyclic AMP receptor protein
MATEATLLSEVPLFALLDDQERAQLAERLDIVRVGAGTTLFNVGDPGGSVYIVREGEVELFFKNDTGERIVLETATPGDFFGEISLLDGGPRSASALVTKDLEALVVDHEDLQEFLRVRPLAAMDLLAATGRRLRDTAQKLRNTASRNVNEEIADKRTRLQRIADWISDFSGSLPFLFLHLGWFVAWIALNEVGLRFDPFPFGLLTMVVSLEAIVLSVFVLLSQNRQAARDRIQRDIEYEVNLKAELEIAHLHEKVDHMQAEVLRRLDNIEKARGRPA